MGKKFFGINICASNTKGAIINIEILLEISGAKSSAFGTKVFVFCVKVGFFDIKATK